MHIALLPLIFPAVAGGQAGVLTLKGLPDWRLRRFRSQAELLRDWPTNIRADDFWLRPGVLSFLVNQPQGLTTEPLLVENITDGRLVLLTAQSFYFNAGGQVSDAAKGATSGVDIRRRLLSPFSFRVLCLGQFLVSGNYASAGLDELTAAEASQLLPAVAEVLTGGCYAYAGVIIKDLCPAEADTVRLLRARGFHPLPADPQLIVDIPPHWNGMEDYLADLKSKYRVRYRRARAKLDGLTRRRLTAEEVSNYRDRIYELYKCTAAGSDFNAVALTPEYFPWLARAGSKFSLRPKAFSRPVDLPGGENGQASTQIEGYFTTTGRMVGFTSVIANGRTLHAHFLGMEEGYKHSHHLYHNMLFDLLERAIKGGVAVLDYARTAPEIKTSVGAVSRNPAVLLKARSGLLNRLVPFFTSAVYQPAEWTPRNPFRGS